MTEEQLAASRAQLVKDLSNLPSRRKLAWDEIQRGVDPKWVACKYLFPVEEMLKAKEEHERRSRKD